MVPFYSNMAQGIKRVLALGLFVCCGCLAVSKANEAAFFDRWLQVQTNIQTWSADLRQTRSLKALTHPLRSEGKMWYVAPRRFRWELGHPPETIVVREEAKMLLYYPALKRAEQYNLEQAEGPMKETLTLMEGGFPQSRADMEQKFLIKFSGLTNGLGLLSLQPRSLAARRLMSRFDIWFSTNTYLLNATELFFADGSALRNDFFNHQTNQPISTNLMTLTLPAEVQLTTPLQPSANAKRR